MELILFDILKDHVSIHQPLPRLIASQWHFKFTSISVITVCSWTLVVSQLASAKNEKNVTTCNLRSEFLQCLLISRRRSVHKSWASFL